MVEVVEKIEVRSGLMPLPLETKPPKPVELDEMGKVLLKARDYIREHGWCQNSLWSETGRACVLGAIALTASNVDEYMGARNRFADSLGLSRTSIYGISAIGNWNDTTDRTQQEVEERLERAAYNL